MPNKPTANKLQCRYCKLQAPEVIIKHVKGLPLGECRDCNRNRQLRARLQANFHLNLYKSLPDLVSANLKVLSILFPGTYSLSRNGLKTQVGYIIVQIDSIYVNVYNDGALYKYDLFGIASLLGNSNVFIDANAKAPASLSGEPAIDPDALQGVSPIDVQERLIWYNSALMAKALKLLRAETKQAKQANMAIAHAKRVKAPAD
jgi:hypothetical protein